MNATVFFTPREYALFRRCSVRTLDRERAEGRGCPYIRVGSRILYRRVEIEKFLDACVKGVNGRVPNQSRRNP
jgi:hypothetical protein